jgi:hypothetical protein
MDGETPNESANYALCHPEKWETSHSVSNPERQLEVKFKLKKFNFDHRILVDRSKSDVCDDDKTSCFVFEFDLKTLLLLCRRSYSPPY